MEMDIDCLGALWSRAFVMFTFCIVPGLVHPQGGKLQPDTPWACFVCYGHGESCVCANRGPVPVLHGPCRPHHAWFPLILILPIVQTVHIHVSVHRRPPWGPIVRACLHQVGKRFIYPGIHMYLLGPRLADRCDRLFSAPQCIEHLLVNFPDRLLRVDLHCLFPFCRSAPHYRSELTSINRGPPLIRCHRPLGRSRRQEFAQTVTVLSHPLAIVFCLFPSDFKVVQLPLGQDGFPVWFDHPVDMVFPRGGKYIVHYWWDPHCSYWPIGRFPNFLLRWRHASVFILAPSDHYMCRVAALPR
mmetsp:Transcript_102956/g.177633  ORF Transcript_102956/g.177633 Transcript_102956/m.177633 type:complete len:300 (+) Transcript_102956:2163-3062(+)